MSQSDGGRLSKTERRRQEQSKILPGHHNLVFLLEEGMEASGHWGHLVDQWGWDVQGEWEANLRQACQEDHLVDQGE